MKKRIDVSITVEVEVDETKFTEEFMREFRKSFLPFMDIDDHIHHIAALVAAGKIDIFTDFIEGYGKPEEFGIKWDIEDIDTSEWA